MQKVLDNVLLRNAQNELERTHLFADYIYKLFDEVLNSCRDVGEIILYEKDFKYLGKKEVPCIFHITDFDITLILDYSFMTLSWCKSFDNIKISYLIFKHLLFNKGIIISREMDHPEYENDSSLRCKDLIILQKKRNYKVKSI